MLPAIQIKDNFLTDKEFKIIQNNIYKINYQPMKNECGNYGFRHFFTKNTENAWLFNKIKNQFFPNVNLKIDHSSYHLRHNNNKVLEHLDDQDYNFLLYVKGKELICNGTGFYTNNILNTYIGFVENRALFFDGKNNLHTNLQSLGESSVRYTINIFYKYCAIK
tara:strand:- start:3350 stop:3841 length:492 start_codon:yes stop_codon:yes gene_type:complete